MELSDLLTKIQLDPAKVLVLRHRPPERQFRRIFPWLAFQRPELFNFYQRFQQPRVESQMQQAEYVATFIGHTPGLAFFVGLYQVGVPVEISTTKLATKPELLELKKLGIQWKPERPTQLLFELEETNYYKEWKGKLIVAWPPPGIAWARWGDKQFSIRAILEESVIDGRPPDWRNQRFTWAELDLMPTKWRSILSECKGIYFIFDACLSKGYVGSASGSESILGRWLDYAKTGHGGNKRLRKCKPVDLHFSVLEVVPSDMDRKEIIEREGMWKVRLHTREHGLNEN